MDRMNNILRKKWKGDEDKVNKKEGRDSCLWLWWSNLDHTDPSTRNTHKTGPSTWRGVSRLQATSRVWLRVLRMRKVREVSLYLSSSAPETSRPGEQPHRPGEGWADPTALRWQGHTSSHLKRWDYMLDINKQVY